MTRVTDDTLNHHKELMEGMGKTPGLSHLDQKTVQDCASIARELQERRVVDKAAEKPESD